ncbi:MAG: SCO family protein [Fimbriimonas sp.]|nr:SCO family protein [Fimbriimonas sp.]
MSKVSSNGKKEKPMWVAMWPLLGLLFLFMPRGTQSSALTRSMGITQKLGQTVPKDLPFTDEQGNAVKLGDMFRGKPVVVVPIFYSCRTGCAILTDNIIKTLSKATRGDILKPGRDMDVLMYSIDPKEDANLAHSKKALIFNALTPHLSTPAQTAAWRGEAEKGWHLLTGNLKSVQALSQAIGFTYSYRQVPDLDRRKTVWLINHPTCTVLLTPEGKISSYTIGNEFQTKEVEEDLKVAQRGEVGHSADQSMMFGCIMVDPATGRNRVVIENVWKVAGVFTILALAVSIVTLSLKSKRENSNSVGGLGLQ